MTNLKSHISRIKWPIRSRAVSTFPAGALAKRYGFPVLQQVSSQYVAIIELCDGYPQLMSDLQAYCTMMNIPMPPINLIGVDGASVNNPSMAGDGANSEVALDIQNVAGATGGLVPIVVYFTPNSTQGFVDAILKAASNPQVCSLSISWGQAEISWSPSDRSAMDAAFQKAAAEGISCFAASGDDGSADQTPTNTTDYPAASPYCTGCGGTTITSTAETAWNYGGGGYSKDYDRPTWQTTANLSRMVPDVAADADPNSGYQVIIEGSWQTIGGTSAVSPMWAALIALIVSKSGTRFGLINAKLWSLQPLFTDIVTGSNGGYKAGVGPDPCTGLGVPNATLVGQLTGNPIVPPPPINQPPPINPPPVNPPPINPPPPTATLRQEFDAVFAVLENMALQQHNRMAYIELVTVQRWVDAYLQSHPSSTPPQTEGLTFKVR